jgi:AGZA family xanthine/uracil permease-like MFS transporter
MNTDDPKPTGGGLWGLLERWFRLGEHGTTARTEVLGGVTTFLTMAYIIVVNPAILEKAGIPRGPSTVATILAAVFGSLLMGLYANRPIAVAPYMGENAFIAFSLNLMRVNGEPIHWRQRLGSVFLAGAAFLVLTLLRLRTWLANAISPSLKHSFAVGIGLFLLLIGLYETGVVTSFVTGLPVTKEMLMKVGPQDLEVLRAPPAPLKIGSVHQPAVLLAIFGFVFTSVLLYWNVRGGILIGIIGTAVAGYLVGVGKVPEQVVAAPWDRKYALGEVAGQLDVETVLHFNFLPILITLFLISFLDTVGTLVGVGSAGGMLDEQGNFKEIEKPMLVDATSCMFSAVIGTSTSGAYIESAAGIREGARTGLAAVTTALLFAAALFFIPLFEPLQDLKYAYGPALMAVGVLMIAAVTRINFNDPTETVPALVTIALILFTYNIANGLTAGLVLYPLFKVLAGRWREVNGGVLVLGALCLIYFVYGVPH